MVKVADHTFVLKGLSKRLAAARVQHLLAVERAPRTHAVLSLEAVTNVLKGMDMQSDAHFCERM
jgi:hypothetical protein